ncbi:WD40-repeat-containing domain protein [Fomitopsis serialis]|uniref:WD40-repeat-containing domain protein n=1 Tax=Fomitopsis serialis TaxID=139415 RepID=UPI002008CA8F|nr:WD40-repeat-containing domain protein [Neoantrodia serialis]KAH9938149.1 WD40-repeat-containing domain protein [Neoantrodia serialis]
MTQHLFGLTSSPSTSIPSLTSSTRRKRRLLSASLQQPLDRVNVLGDDRHGHTGCVNALSWAKDGELLISGGDDTTVRTSEDYPFKCETVIYTGHRGNIFNAHMLPHSTRIATVAADRQYSGETEYTSSQANVKALRCHSGRVKRIVTEESPDMFLTVGEDGTVRQHDLRVPHICASGNCPAPLVRLSHQLNTIALSPLTPYQFVVAGESQYGYLFDRRHAGRIMKEEWGMLPDSDDVTTCVRRFGRAARGPGESKGYEHITGAKMSCTNGHEADHGRTAYSSDAVYLYRRTMIRLRVLGSGGSVCHRINVSGNRHTRLRPKHEGEDEDEEGEEGDDDDNHARANNFPMASTSEVPIVYPRARFTGACNVETVKDVNFLGPQDEYVASGSDDGNLFIWRKATGQLHDILEGDGSVVNVIEGHPHLPLVAVSGIDTTVKLFGPARGSSGFSRLMNAENIMKRNSEAQSRRVNFAGLFLQYQLARHASGETQRPGTDCPVQ